MKTFTIILKYIEIIILSFIVIIIINLGHDPLINAIVAGHAKNHIPSGQTAELISLIKHHNKINHRSMKV